MTIKANGPVPARSDQRRRRNKVEGAPELTKSAASEVTAVPSAEDSWHRIARDWYESLAKSGQAVFFEPSDWATAHYVAEAMSRNLDAERFSAVLFAAVMSASSSLLVTEGDRRRLRVELEREKTSDPDAERADAMILDLKSRLGG